MKREIFFKKNSINFLYIILFWFIVLIIWEGMFRLNFIKAAYLSAPSKIIRTALLSLQTGEWHINMVATIGRFILVLFPAVLFGSLAGWIIGLNTRLKIITMPIVIAVLSVPKLLLIPLFMFFLGKSLFLNILPAFFAIFILTLGGALAGAENIEPAFFDIGRNYGAGRLNIFTKIVLPGSLPLIWTSLEMAVAVCLRIIVISEFITAVNQGIGALLRQGWKTSNFESIYVGLFSLLFLILFISWIMRFSRRVLIPWRD